MNKELYQDAIKVIDILLEKSVLCDEDGGSLFGEAQWEILRQWFKGNGKYAVYATNQALNKQGLSELKALRLRCEQAIEQITKEDYDRDLRNRESLANIRGVKTAKITAWVAIAISIAALIVAILEATIWK